jgi:hypothetical protein
VFWGVVVLESVFEALVRLSSKLLSVCAHVGQHDQIEAENLLAVFDRSTRIEPV